MPNDVRVYTKLREKAQLMGAGLEPNPICLQARKDGSLVSKLVTYSGPPLLSSDEHEFHLPMDFGQLEAIIALHQSQFRDLIHAMESSNEGFVIMDAFESSELAEKLQDLAVQAGGTLEFADPDENGVIVVKYYRYTRLKNATLPTNATIVKRWHRRTSTSYLIPTCHYYTLYFYMPVHYDLLCEILRRDIEIYNGLPEEAKRPAGWKG